MFLPEASDSQDGEREETPKLGEISERSKNLLRDELAFVDLVEGLTYLSKDERVVITRLATSLERTTTQGRELVTAAARQLAEVAHYIGGRLQDIRGIANDDEYAVRV